jgi:uncharacterized protein YehS (DUF1456 family)
MTYNDVMRRIRYIFDFNDSKMIGIFALAEREVTRAEISDWLKREEDPSYRACSDELTATFLNGLITEKRGPSKWGHAPPEKRLTNNLILTKLKIALALRAEDILEILASADVRISKHELSAFFRKPGHKHYRLCQDQILRNFLKGLQIKLRAE